MHFANQEEGGYLGKGFFGPVPMKWGDNVEILWKEY